MSSPLKRLLLIILSSFTPSVLSSPLPLSLSPPLLRFLPFPSLSLRGEESPRHIATTVSKDPP